MRIISGSLRGKKLAGFSGQTIRPTSDRLREAIFNILASRLRSWSGLTVLDLFAGTGALAIEALSRGVQSAVLVEQDRQAAALIESNLKACGLLEKTTVYRADALQSLDRLAATGSFDLIFLDPPYGKNLASKALQRLVELRLLAPGALVLVETDKTEVLPDSIGPLLLDLHRQYGAAALHLYTHHPQEAP